MMPHRPNTKIKLSEFNDKHIDGIFEIYESFGLHADPDARRAISPERFRERVANDYSQLEIRMYNQNKLIFGTSSIENEMYLHILVSTPGLNICEKFYKKLKLL